MLTNKPNKTMALDPDKPIRFSSTHRLQWEEAQQKTVILYPEGMVELNQSSAEILKCCDGVRNLAQIINALEEKFATSGLANDITAFLEVALQHGWIQQ
ncbi:pyrroloquinoline quinone biosynthesis peptide chaperone PqqD [Methylosoma difficile]